MSQNNTVAEPCGVQVVAIVDTIGFRRRLGR